MARVCLEDGSLLNSLEVGNGSHNFDRIFVGNREAVVTAHQDAIAPDLAYQKVQNRRTVANGVVMKAAKV